MTGPTCDWASVSEDAVAIADLGDRLADGGGLDHRGAPRTDAGDAARVVLGSGGHEVADVGGPVPRVGGCPYVVSQAARAAGSGVGADAGGW